MSSNLAQLPTDPTGGGSIGGAVQMTAVEQDNVINNLQRQINNQTPSSQPNMQENSTINLSQNTISELVTGLQKASNNGNTGLSTRDIPVNESRVATDEKIVPDYIPPVEEDDYVELIKIMKISFKNTKIRKIHIKQLKIYMKNFKLLSL